MDDPTLVSLGAWIKRRRKALDLTQDALANLAGCSKDLIVKIEGDARRPSRQLAALLAEHLQLAPDERDAFVRSARAELAPDRLPPPAKSVPRAAFVSAAPSAAAAAADLPHGTVTFLFTDVEGSTRLWEQHGAATGAALARHEALLHQVVASVGGVVFKTTGDGICAAFADAPAALSAAVSGQRALQAKDWEAISPLRVRMALHTGVVESRERDYAGLALSRVARLLAAAHGGQVLLSLAAAELVRDHLPPEVALRDLGLQRLKDLSRPEQVFQPIVPDLPAAFPPLRTLDAHRTNLPSQPTRLIGRERELAQLSGVLARADVRLVTLTGPGGTGKTRLGLQVAAELVEAFADGAFFVDLAPISDPDLVVMTIAQTLGVTATGERPAEQLKAALRHQRLLLLLDNYEQLLAAAPLVAELLAAAPGLKVLVTSRVVLHLSGEHEYVVTPLALPPLTGSRAPAGIHRDAQLQAESSSQYAAVQLFIQRAQAAKADFAVTNANAPAVGEICVRLDGLPLAIEMAAARIKLFPPEALLARLSRPLAFLTGGARDLPARQQTIRSTIDWSYKLLSSDEQRLFRRLGVFVSGWTIDAAEAVSRDQGSGNTVQRSGETTLTFEHQPLTSILDGLAALVDHSLVMVLEPVAGEPRYGMLETLREYALEQLQAASEEVETRRRHAAYFASWAEELVANTGDGDLLTSERLTRELGNVRAALTWSLGRSDEDARYGLRLFGCLWELWFVRYWDAGSVIAEQALACASAGPQDLVAAQIYNAAARMPPSDAHGAYSIELLERSLALARQYHDRALEAEVLRHLGEELNRHDLERAEHVLTESLLICRELNDLGQEAWTTYGLGMIAKYRGDHAAAERSITQSLALFARLGHPLGQAIMLRYLAYLAEERGDPAAADGYLAQVLAFADQLGPTSNHSPWFEQSQIAFRRGDYQRAVELLQTGYDQARQRGDLALDALLWLARCYQERGELDAATACCRQVLASMLAQSVPRGDLINLAILTAHTAALSGQYDVGAQVLGCIAAERATENYPADFWWEPEWNHLHDRALAMCRAELGAATFETGWMEGQGLSLEQMVEQALAALEPGEARKAPERTV